MNGSRVFGTCTVMIWITMVHTRAHWPPRRAPPALKIRTSLWFTMERSAVILRSVVSESLKVFTYTLIVSIVQMNLLETFSMIFASITNRIVSKLGF